MEEARVRRLLRTEELVETQRGRRANVFTRMLLTNRCRAASLEQRRTRRGRSRVLPIEYAKRRKPGVRGRPNIRLEPTACADARANYDHDTPRGTRQDNDVVATECTSRNAQIRPPRPPLSSSYWICVTPPSAPASPPKSSSSIPTSIPFPAFSSSTG